MLGLSMPFSKTASLVLGILGLIVAYQAITGIHAESIGPNSKILEEKLGSFGGQTVHIGGVPDGVGDNQVRKPDKAANAPDAQFRGLVAFNMLSAANCNTVMAVDKLLRDPTDVKSGDRLRHFGEYDYKNPGEDEDEDEIETNPFDALVNRTNFDPTCYGANTIDVNPVPKFQNINPFTPDVSEAGNDMEGKMGRIDFSINERFTIGDHDTCDQDDLIDEDCPEILMGTWLKSLKLEDKNHPDFYKSHRLAAFVPAYLRNQGGWDSQDVEIYNDEITGTEEAEIRYGEMKNRHQNSIGWIGDNQDKMAKLYSYRIRMKNVPGTVPADPTFLTKENNRGSHDSEGKYERLVEEIEWRFCPSAEGFIQSNAYQLGKEDEAAGGDYGSKSKKENSVYPKVVITNNKFGEDGKCIPGRAETKSDLKFYGGTAMGETCSETSIEGEGWEGIDFSGDGNPEIELKCFYKDMELNKDNELFSRFKNEIKHVYRPGWFIKECDNNPGFSFKEDYAKHQKSNIEKDNGDVILKATEEGDQPQVTWSFPSEGKLNTFNIEFKNDFDGNAKENNGIITLYAYLKDKSDSEHIAEIDYRKSSEKTLLKVRDPYKGSTNENGRTFKNFKPKKYRFNIEKDGSFFITLYDNNGVRESAGLSEKINPSKVTGLALSIAAGDGSSDNVLTVTEGTAKVADCN